MSIRDNAKAGACEKSNINHIVALPLCDNNNKETESDNLVLNRNDDTQETNKNYSIRVYDKKLLWRLPWCIIGICMVQVIFYYVANDCMYQRLMLVYQYRHQYWRYATYMFLHADLIHLVLNVCLQLLISFSLENEQGRWKVIGIFLCGGISGSIATVILQPHLSLLGASAGVYALLLSHVPHLVKNFAVLSYRYLRIICLCLLCLSDWSFTTFHYIVNHNLSPRICLEAHLAGGVCGLCLGMLFYNKFIDNYQKHTNIV